jgi:DNA-binding MarR family transcriptional regulator
MKHAVTNVQEIARRTLEIIPFVMRVMTAEMRSSQLDIAPSHMGLLGMLTVRPYTLGELAKQMAVSAPTMSNTITVLETRGWVTRERDKTDRRVVYVTLSHEGRQMLGAIDHYTAQRISEYLAPLNDQERQTLLDGLTLLHERFTAAMGGHHVPIGATGLHETTFEAERDED